MLRLSVWAVVGLLFVAEGLLVAAELKGKIKSIDADKKEITLTTKDGKDETFEVKADAKITIGKDKEAKLDDLKTGTAVTIVYEANGRGKVKEIRTEKE